MNRRPSFPELAIRRLARTTSTQDVVRRAAIAGAPEGVCCVADEQTAGRGRQGRTWSAPAGSALLASVLLRRPARIAPAIPFAAGLAVLDSIADANAMSLRLKWPNDVMAGGRKLAGILCEVEPEASTPDALAIVVGIGLNLSVDSFPAGVDAVSFHELAPPPDRLELLGAWLAHLHASVGLAAARGLPAVLERWRRVATGLGQTVRATSGDREVVGIAEDVDDSGALLIRSDAGTMWVVAGDVHLTSPPASGQPAD